MYRQTAGCNAGTAGAYDHRAGWKLPRGGPRGALGMDALTTEGYAGKRPAEHFKRFKGLKAGKRQARLERPNNRVYVQANGRLQRRNNRDLREQQGLMATLGMEALTTEGYAGKRPAEHFIEGWQTVGLKGPTTEAMCRQTAGCNAGTTGAYGHRAG